METLGPSEGHGHIRLACQACQRKKIKCDRIFPCGQCLRSSLQCVPSQRKPRARHAGKRAVDSELRSRISKLESLVESLSGEVGLPDDPDEGEDTTAPLRDGETDTPDDPGIGLKRYIASSFWSSLTSEVQALREVLEDDNELEEDSLSPETSSSGGNASQQTQEYELIICPPGAVYVMPGALNEPLPHLQSELYGIYMDHVAPIIKTFHLPSLRRMLERGEPYLGQEASSPGNKAVRAVLWFAAANALKEEEAQARYGLSKTNLVTNYRRYADVLLSQADLLVTTDMATVQAFSTYLSVARGADHSRRVWTLTSLIVRIARAMGLHRESPGQHSVYLTELRRRLWLQIRFIDAQNAGDRGTEPLILPGSYDTPPPSNVNDADFDETSTMIVPREKGLTEMAFSLLVHEAAITGANLEAPPETNSKGDPWQSRIDIAENFGRRVQDNILQYCDLNIVHHRVVYKVAKSMTAGMVLRAVRPLNFKHVNNIPAPRIDSPHVLKIALDLLRSGEGVHEDPDAARWRWLIWVHWHPLAVALAGLCSIRDTELAETAWPIVVRSYFRHAQNVADSRTGMLWRPIEKLYRRAALYRNEGRRESQSTHGQTSPSTRGQSSPESLPNFPYANTDNTSPQTWPSTDFDPLNRSTIPLVDPMLAHTAMDFSSPPEASAAGIATLSLTGNQALALPPNDMGWLDWERIMSDMSTYDQSDPSQHMPGMNIDASATFPIPMSGTGMRL